MDLPWVDLSVVATMITLSAIVIRIGLRRNAAYRDAIIRRRLGIRK